MATAPAPNRRFSIDDLSRFPDDGRLRELVDGRIVEWDVPNVRHNFVLSRLAFLLTSFVEARDVGTVLTTDTMVRIQHSEYDARGADIAYYAPGRFPLDIDAAATEVVPDFVIEVLSPSDRRVDVEMKVRDWLRTGVALLWYVDPTSGVTMVYRGADVSQMGADEVLSGQNVLPSFAIRLREILDRLAARQGGG